MTVQRPTFSGSREQIVTEEEFLLLLEEAASGVLALREKVRAGAGKEWRRRLVSSLLKEVHHLRTVLNDYSAKENRTFSYFVELVAGIRGFATIIYVLKHLRERFLRSPFRDAPVASGFLAGISETLACCGRTLRALFSALLAECEQLGIELPEALPANEETAPGEHEVRPRLPHNIDEEEITGEGARIAEVASSFLRAVETYEGLVPPRLETYPELAEFVLRRLDEEEARTITNRVHTIQSKYDTYIQHTGAEARDPDLRRLRAVISLVLHLFEVTTYLVHFYERHENDIRSERTKERIAGIVDKKAVLDRAVNFAFRGAGWFMREGREICLRLLASHTSMQERTFRIPDDVKLHIRPASLIATIVNRYGTPVTMRMGGAECDASSVTEVIFLAGSHYDVKEVTFCGDERPLDDLAHLFEVGLTEEGLSELRRRLPYLTPA